MSEMQIVNDKTLTLLIALKKLNSQITEEKLRKYNIADTNDIEGSVLLNKKRSNIESNVGDKIKFNNKISNNISNIKLTEINNINFSFSEEQNNIKGDNIFKQKLKNKLNCKYASKINIRGIVHSKLFWVII